VPTVLSEAVRVYLQKVTAAGRYAEDVSQGSGQFLRQEP
jgi:hypothetical protein